TVRATSTPPPTQLDALPMSIADWRGEEAGPIDEETARILASDAYLNRVYDDGTQAPVGLYIAYYAMQRPGVSIHSPLHCLPGTGWEPLDVVTREIRRPDGSTGELRRLVVRKARERAVVLYWYAVHGRMIGNEVVSKAWLLFDSLRLN